MGDTPAAPPPGNPKGESAMCPKHHRKGLFVSQHVWRCPEGGRHLFTAEQIRRANAAPVGQDDTA